MTRTLRARVAGAGLACVLVVLAAWVSLREGGLDGLVTHWWVAGAVATTSLLLLPRRWLLPGAAVTGLLVGATSYALGIDPVVAVALAVGNALEVAVVVAIVTAGRPGRPRLATWGDFRRWMLAVLAGTLLCGALVAAAEGLHHDEQPWRLLLWVALTHAAGQVMVLPLFFARESRPVRVGGWEVAAHLSLLAVGLLLFLSATPEQPVAYLLLSLLAWSASRFPPHWAAVELYAVAVGAAATSRVDLGALASIRPDASVVDMAASAQTFITVAGVTSITFVVAMTSLRESSRRHREDEARLSQLMDSADGTAFIATDLRGTITWFSPGAEQLTGYASEEMVGERDPLVLHDAREILSRASALGIVCSYDIVTHPVRTHEVADTRDWTYVHRDGRRLTVSVNVSPVRDRAGRVEGFLSVVRDVTDRRAAEQALVLALDKERETIRRMRELDRAKNDFVSSVSHELRTPLTSIVGYTELLRGEIAEPLTGAQDHLVEKIDRNSGRLLHLVEDLLTLARVEDGALRVDKVETDLAVAVRTAVEEMAHAARKAGVSLQLQVPEGRVPLHADPHQVERLVLNLVSNAVKFTPSGGRVDVRLRASSREAVVEVADTGVGIPEEEQDQLFGRFFRSTTATENAIQGTGLGLSIVRSIAEAHGGTIGFSSAVGHGTTFTFTVPLVPDAGDRPVRVASATAPR